MFWLAVLMLGQSVAADAPLRAGTVNVAPLPSDAGPIETRHEIVGAVKQALIDADFIVLPPPGQGRYTATVKVARATRGAVASNSREPRADALAGNWGVGLNVAMPSNKRQLRGLVVTELTIELTRRGETVPAWTGRASTAQLAGTPADAPDALARKLASAVLRQFPEGSGEGISVP